MNRLKSIVDLTRRGYKNISRNQSLSLRKNNKVNTEKQLYSNFEESDLDNHEDEVDLEHLDADFMGAGEVYNEHKRELRYNKELLKMRITASKYFKTKEPNFLTWSERSQIKNLHDKDNQEWTPERLSTAFPALPETIKKVLKSNYMPKTAEAVIRYDQNVVDNWNQFKAGNLALSPQLEAHLQKFKDRNIQITNLKTIAEKFVKPKPVFSSPNCTMFSSIVKDYTESKCITDEKPSLQLNDGTVTNDSTVRNDTTSSELVVQNAHNNVKRDWKYATSDIFLEKKVNEITDHSNLSVEDKFFLQEYRDKKNKESIIDSEELIVTKQDKTLDLIEKTEITESPVINNEPLQPHTMQDNISKPQVMQVSLDKIETYKNSLDTGIIEWKKKSALSEEENYPNYIKVPYRKAKKGVLFRVKDRYYDCDGEFLYRVPGLKT
ncbi:uncharacterized protein [Chelonus insularis]|uniref:uncharacterized protein n=1 Tax=Chelonus insularis TaxID=460826 RepID=UPI00158C5173|nr:uncharacterized protein LOC118068995 [Chelonus insularis]